MPVSHTREINNALYEYNIPVMLIPNNKDRTEKHNFYEDTQTSPDRDLEIVRTGMRLAVYS